MTLDAEAIYQHAKCPEWGLGVIVEEQPDRVRFLFEHGGARTMLRGNEAVRAVELPDEERVAVHRAILRRHAPPKTTRGTSARRPRHEEALTFDAQEALFRARFPLGFEDPTYVRTERGTATGRDRYKDYAISLGQRTLSTTELDDLIAREDFAEVFKRAVAVLRATLNLAFPKTEKPMFEAMPPASHPAFALALRDLLHGTGDYTARFDRLVSTLAMKTVPWTVSTLFPAVVHPTEQAFVKPTCSVRQARILRLDEPPLGLPTGAGYAQHLAVALALRSRLFDAGYRPRDLFDVYTFGWITQRGKPNT